MGDSVSNSDEERNVGRPLVPLGIRQLRHGHVIHSHWCSLAGMPFGTTIDQLDGRTIRPEHPDALVGFVTGQLAGPSAAQTRLIPLPNWPEQFRFTDALVPQLSKRLERLGLGHLGREVTEWTISDFLSIRGLSAAAVVQIGCAVEAEVVARLARRAELPRRQVSNTAHQSQRSQTAASQSGAAELASVPELLWKMYGVVAQCAWSRFEELGWLFAGETDVLCGDCQSDAPFVVFRRPYATTRGAYRHWAIVCRTCGTVNALGDFEPSDQTRFREWESAHGVAGVETSHEPLRVRVHGPTVAHDPVGGTDEPILSHRPALASTDPVPTLVDDCDVAPPPEFEVGPSGHELVLLAARAELAAAANEERYVDMGEVEAIETDGSIGFRIHSPLMNLSEQPAAEAFLARSLDESQRVPVSILRSSAVEVVATAEGQATVVLPMRLFVKVDPAVVLKAVVEFLETRGSEGLASVLVGRGLLSSVTGESLEGLDPDQSMAAGAILSPGVAVVWGPPGTGKTRVIGLAVAELVRRGKRVALVSSTNLAVDQALIQVVGALHDSAAGQLVRVGHPSLQTVTDHPHLLLRKALESRHRDLAGRIERIERDLASVRFEAATLRSAPIASFPDRWDREMVDGLMRRRSAAREPYEIERDLAVLAVSLDDAIRARSAQSDELDHAQGRLARWDGDLEILDDEAALDRLEKTISALEQEVAASESADTSRTRSVGRAGRNARHRLPADISAVSALESARRQRDEHAQRLARAAERGIQPATIRFDQAAERSANAKVRATLRQIVSIEARIRQLENDRSRAEDGLNWTAEEREVLEQLDRCGSCDAVLDERAKWRDRSMQVAARFEALTVDLHQAERELRGREAELLQAANVVGTTLAQLCLHTVLKSLSFDFVVIDEASAASPTAVYSAMCMAKQGCTVIGDFEQNGPINRCDASELPDAVRPWVSTSIFDILGVNSASAALQTDGCAVLRTQYRFGPLTMRLANELAYGGLLRQGRDDQLPVPDGPEIVIVDTSSLRGAAMVNRGPSGKGRWWAAGACVSAWLASSHASESVGIITPYRHQVQLTRARLSDVGAKWAQVGTSHSVQGLEFPVVVVDLVEDGTGTSWVARASRSGTQWQRAGAQLFNVAVTRNAGRLYVISNIPAILAAPTGPLTSLASLVRSREAEVWDARDLVGGGLGTAAKIIPTARLDRNVDSEVISEVHFYDALLRDFEGAAERVVIFSPFLAARRVELLRPQLSRLVDRGVRVTVFTKHGDEIHQPRLVKALQESGIVVRERRGMHEKVVIVDDDIVYVGSLNPLSNAGNTNEIMLRITGQETSEKLSRWLRDVVRATS